MEILFEVQHKIFSMPYKHLENPDILNKKESTIQALVGFDTGIQYILDKIFILASTTIAFIGYVTIVSTLSVYILAYLLLSVVVFYYFSLKISKYESAKQLEIWGNDRESNYYKSLMNDFSYGKDIRIYNLNEWILNKVRQVMGKSISLTKDIRQRYFRFSILEFVLAMIRDGLVYGYLVYLVINNSIQIGDFLMYFATVAGFAQLLNTIIVSVTGIKAQGIHISNVRDFLELVEEDDQGELTVKPPYNIRFENVCFKYPNTDRLILDKLSITIKHGEKLAIVGENGSGKTTFIKLLTRLYEPTEGAIFINDVNIKHIPKRECYKMFSVIFQDYKILAFSAAENITLEDKTSDPNKLTDSMKKAQVFDKVSSLPKKEDTAMLKNIDDEGVELSQGEKQKIALARALYKDGGIILLDEPTASLSPIAEEQIYRNFNDMTLDKTTVFISHRLASTRFCDKIAFFEKGKVVEYGTHDELMSNKKSYANMYNIQSQYYREGESVIC
jgi:ATP-binding cassette subfamily C protein